MDTKKAPYIVQKYGGTSVGKFLSTIVETITPSFLETNRVVIVCSARSGKTKALGTTNLLLKASAQALEHESQSPSSSLMDSQLSVSGSFANSVSRPDLLSSQPFYETVQQIQQDHLLAARSSVQDTELLEQLELDIKSVCEYLLSVLQAARVLHEVSYKSRDVIMGIGERLSCMIVTAALKDHNHEAQLITLDTIVDEMEQDTVRVHTSADDAGYLDQAFYDKLATKLGEKVAQCDGIPVVTGYFGNVPGSLLSQVGRGYTDLCAALCAVGLQADELQIWKEVDGVFTADPRKVPTARLVPAITPEEAAELTYYGSEVIHPFTMEQAIKKSVPIRIKNVENPTGCGTVIFPDKAQVHNTSDIEHDPFVDGHVEQPQPPTSNATTPTQSIASLPANANEVPPIPMANRKRRLPTAVTIKDNVMVLNVHSNRKTISHGFFARIFGTLDRYGVVVDLISTSEVHVSMAMTAEIKSRTLERLSAELEHVGTVSVLRSMVILSLVGKEMRHMVGVAGRMFSTLAEGNINIEMISQGANEINISCVIHERAALKALNLIHYSILELSPKPSNMESGTFGRSFF